MKISVPRANERTNTLIKKFQTLTEGIKKKKYEISIQNNLFK